MNDHTFLDWLTLMCLAICLFLLAAGLWSHDIAFTLAGIIFSIGANILQYVVRRLDS